MLCFAAIVPHPVISIPHIGQAGSDKISATVQAFERIKQELYSAKPDTVVFITPHANNPAETLSINQNKELQISFKSFGDLTPHGTVSANLALGYRLRERVETACPLITIDDTDLDHGTAVPLFHFFDKLGETKVVVLGTASSLSLADHFNCGQLMRKPLETTNERVAVIVSSDLSHDKANNDSKKNSDFDSQIIRLMEKNKVKELLSTPAELAQECGECGLRPIALLFGLLDQKNYSLTTVSYERSLGIGYYSGIIHF